MHTHIHRHAHTHTHATFAGVLLGNAVRDLGNTAIWAGYKSTDCIIRVWVRDAASGPGPRLVHTTLFCSKQWSPLILSPSTVLLSMSLVPARIFLFLTVLGFFDWSMVVPFSFFFFQKKSCATGGQTLRRPDSPSTCTAHRMRFHCRTQKKQHCKKKSRKLAYWQDRTLSRRKLLSSEHEHGCRSSTSPGCDQLSPSRSPVAQNWGAVFIYLLILFYWNEPRGE